MIVPSRPPRVVSSDRQLRTCEDENLLPPGLRGLLRPPHVAWRVVCHVLNFETNNSYRRTHNIRALILRPAARTRCTLANGDHETMNLEQNKAIARNYLNEIVNKGNMAAFDSYFSEDVVFNNAKGFKQQYPARMQTIRSAFPDHDLTIEDQIAEGDKVVTRVTFRGTHQGQLNGIAPTGRKVQWSGIAMDRIANGKVVEMWHVQNTTGLLQQIGAAASTVPKK